MVNPKKVLAEPDGKQTNSGLSHCPQTPFVPRRVWPMWSLISGVDNCILVTIRWSHVYKYVSPLGSAWLGEGARGFQPHPSPSSTSVGRSRSGSSTVCFTYTTATTAEHQSVEEEVAYFYYDLLRSTPTTTTADHSSLPLSQLHQSTLPQSMLSPTIKTVRMRMRTMVMINNSWEYIIMIWGGDAYHDSNTWKAFINTLVNVWEVIVIEVIVFNTENGHFWWFKMQKLDFWRPKPKTETTFYCQYSPNMVTTGWCDHF